MNQPARVSSLSHVVVGTKDLDASVAFYTEVLRLRVERDDSWVRLEPSTENRVLRVAYRVDDAATLDQLTANIEAEGLAVDRGLDSTGFVDPAGQTVELLVAPPPDANPQGDVGIAMQRLLHAVWHAPDLDTTVKFYERALGFRVSDRIDGAAAFLRCADGYHHSLALLAGPPRFNHVCILVADLDDVMRMRQHVLRHGATLQMDVLRHAPSGSIGVYVADPAHGLAIEFCCDHEQVPDDHQARLLPLAAETLDVWKAPLAPMSERVP